MEEGARENEIVRLGKRMRIQWRYFGHVINLGNATTKNSGVEPNP